MSMSRLGCVWSVGADQRRLEVHSAGTGPVVSVAVHNGLYCRYARHHLPGADDLRQSTFDHRPGARRHQLASSRSPVLCLHCLHHLCCTGMCCLAAAAVQPVVMHGDEYVARGVASYRTKQNSAMDQTFVTNDQCVAC